MKERSFDEMVAYFNHRVSEMDIDQDYKMELLGMVAALGYKHEKSAQPTEASCWGCNCTKMERLTEQKTFSEMVHLHDAETHGKRTETHAGDLISRQAAIDAAVEAADEWDGGYSRSREEIITMKLRMLPSAQPERKTGKWIKKDCDLLYCSECDLPSLHPWPYCERCGAKMEVEHE